MQLPSVDEDARAGNTQCTLCDVHRPRFAELLPDVAQDQFTVGQRRSPRYRASPKHPRRDAARPTRPSHRRYRARSSAGRRNKCRRPSEARPDVVIERIHCARSRCCRAASTNSPSTPAAPATASNVSSSAARQLAPQLGGVSRRDAASRTAIEGLTRLSRRSSNSAPSCSASKRFTIDCAPGRAAANAVSLRRHEISNHEVADDHDVGPTPRPATATSALHQRLIGSS